MTINNLRKQSLLLKKTNKEKARVYSLLLDKTQKYAKEKRRDPVDADVEVAAKRCLKEAKQSQEAGIDCLDEIEIYKTFLPTEATNEEVSKFIAANYLNSDKIGDIMGGIKKKFGNAVNMKNASELARRYTSQA